MFFPLSPYIRFRSQKYHPHSLFFEDSLLNFSFFLPEQLSFPFYVLISSPPLFNFSFSFSYECRRQLLVFLFPLYVSMYLSFETSSWLLAYSITTIFNFSYLHQLIISSLLLTFLLINLWNPRNFSKMTYLSISFSPKVSVLSSLSDYLSNHSSRHSNYTEACGHLVQNII